MFIPRLSEAIAKAGSLSSPKAFDLDLMGSLRVKVLSSRSCISKSKTSQPFVPATALDIASTLAQFNEYQSKLIGLLVQSKDKAIDEVQVHSTFHIPRKRSL